MVLYTYLLYIIRERRLKRATLRYKIKDLQESSSEAKTWRFTDIQPESEEESIVCPDCFDAMIRFYDWDTPRYLCDNCGSTILPSVILSTDLAYEYTD
jgi:ribosomal protein S27E